MNFLMAGMIPTMKFLMPRIEGAGDPLQPAFWFTMSMALTVGFALAYPVNWWLVANNMKHGMLTVRPGAGDGGEHAGHGAAAGHDDGGDSSGHGGSDDQGEGGHGEHLDGGRPSAAMIVLAIVFTFVVLAGALWLAGGFFG